ncbi:MAG TPA: type II toxin-antitoxin system HipA family toxin [Nitrospira sp.]|nr:type II toxin-antitoxin system HipA family toxin [Nitrospira sp.]HMX93307.1 type II toxin-antitoxin system HipA family toxin [Nitrospira sp.]HNB43517.1 type II toxin-antitoxin system HipA family toxin [Burkholderiaceae bacterium]HNC84774.1 type II toxin-antitoxin system HipA family toxin [Nitrospira sp.]HNG78069.1 type II toxin-antitoxin system HipA family toxin [Burkholderiaceae bacterium]
MNSTASEDQFCVYLDTNLVGRLHRRGDVTRFVFEKSYWLDPDRSVLGIRFEDNRNEVHQSHLRIPSWFSNLLPEGRLREWVAHARGTSVHREMELLAQVGHDLPGAVRIVQANSLVPIETDDSIENPSIIMPDRSPWTFSLAGVGLKFSMLHAGDRLTLPATGEEGDWIVKLPDPNYQLTSVNEFMVMRLAGLSGIEVPEVKLIHRDQLSGLPDKVWTGSETWAYAVRRFDRLSDRSRVHIEDFAQVRGFPPESKYQGSYETVAALFYRRQDTEALREFSRRLVFNVILGNGDAHLKNWSLIYRNKKIPTISPAYDLVSTFVYRPASEGPEKMALHLEKSRRIEKVSLKSFERLERRLNAKVGLGDVVRETIRTICMNSVSLFDVPPGAEDLAGRINLYLSCQADRLLRLTV